MKRVKGVMSVISVLGFHFGGQKGSRAEQGDCVVLESMNIKPLTLIGVVLNM